MSDRRPNLLLVVAAWLAAAGTLAGAGDPVRETRPRDDRPSFLFILTDDLGWQDLGSFGHPHIKTPHLDRLAAQGMRFEQCYASAAVCSPSRAAFMTGRFPARLGVHEHFTRYPERNRERGMMDWLDPDTPTVTRALSQAGYRTGHFGKWHLGNAPGAPGPGAYGIDEHRSFLGSGPGWDVDGTPSATDLAVHDARDPRSDFWTWSTDYFVDAAIAFLEKEDSRPFYLNLWTYLPHDPLRPSADQLAVYAGLAVKPGDFGSWMRDYAAESDALSERMKVYAAAVTALDAALGRLLDRLDELGLADNTLVFLTSDNGPEDHSPERLRDSVGSTGPFRGRKRSLYEGGIRVPCIARWPGRVPAGRVDRTSTVAAVDWLPTVLSLAGQPAGAGAADGEDMSGILRGKPRLRRSALFWEWRGRVFGNPTYKPPSLAIRAGRWKLFSSPDGRDVELYDMVRDPEERIDRASERPKIARRLRARLLGWKRSLPR